MMYCKYSRYSTQQYYNIVYKLGETHVLLHQIKTVLMREYLFKSMPHRYGISEIFPTSVNISDAMSHALISEPIL